MVLFGVYFSFKERAKQRNPDDKIKYGHQEQNNYIHVTKNLNNNKCTHIIQTQAKNYVKYCSSIYEMNKWTFHQLLSTFINKFK